MRPTAPAVITALVSLLAGAQHAPASVFWDVRFDQAAIRDGLDTTLIRSNLIAAANEWTSHLITPPSVTVDVIVRFDTSIPRAGGRSVTSSFVNNDGRFDIFEQALATELRTGADPNGATPDVEIFLNPDYAQNTLWFDPDPYDDLANVPTNRVDAYSIFLHEIGHAIAFNGWREQYTGNLTTYASTFDALTELDPSGFMYFVGDEAMRIYADRVPLTWGNNFHLANSLGFPGDDLIDDLMNGVIFKRGRRYDISILDLAIAFDAGVSVDPANLVIPTPGSSTLLAAGIAIVSHRRR